MIKKLEIRNYALIDSLDIDFPKGLTIITGETGAGKSILLGALGLIMGKRADTKVLYKQDEKCVVEGAFDISAYDLRFFFDENDIDYDPELIVRREISPSGKSRAFVNDTPVRLPILQQLSAGLIDLHRQFDTLDIHQVSFQLRLLDALAGNKERLQNYQHVYRIYQSEKKRLAALKSTELHTNQEAEFLEFQLQEMNDADVQPGEQEQLEVERNKLSNAEGIKRAVANAYGAIVEGEASLINQMEAILIELDQMSPFHNGIESLAVRLRGQVAELEDLGRELNDVGDGADYNPGQIEEIQQRLDIIYRLLNKHQIKSTEDLLALQERFSKKLESLGSQHAEISALEESITKNDKALRKQASELRSKRKAIIAGFEKNIHDRLSSLSMSNAKLQVDLRPLEEPSSTGMDEVHFLFAANKGDRLQEVKDVASGGELARLTLVTKSLVASAIPLPTLIFDEIDTGISGDVALKMGDILRTLSDQHQVVSITHSPQVASKADAHYFVYKKDMADRTVTRVKLLEAEEKVRAIAIMLSQNPPTESALNNARELLEL